MGCGKHSKVVESLPVQNFNNVDLNPVEYQDQVFVDRVDPGISNAVKPRDIKVIKRDSIQSKFVRKSATTKDNFTSVLKALLEELETQAGLKYQAPKFDAEDEKTNPANERRESLINGGHAGKKGFGYGGEQGGDAAIRAAMMRAKREEGKKVDRNVSAFMQLLNEMLLDMSKNDDQDSCKVAVSSALNFCLAVHLRDNAMSEVAERWDLYEILLESCNICSSHRLLLPILKPDGIRVEKEFKHHTNIIDLLKELRVQADVFVMGNEKVGGTDKDTECAKKAIKAVDTIVANTKTELGKLRSQDEKYMGNGDSDEKKVDEKEDAKIRTWLKSKQFEMCDMSKAPFTFQTELDAAAKTFSSNKARLQRIRKEFAALANSLPEGIYVRVNQDRFDMMKVLIVGPSGTPYENGCFIFDLFIPSNYPSAPPMMKSKTTGNGQFRFNPNLYNDGKVCLSLLGTWSGPGWDPEVSTILQLLVSTQAMILVEFPYENEPAYQGMANSPDSLAYNKAIRYATVLYAMSWMVNPSSAYPAPSYFQDVVYAHFKLIRNQLPTQFDAWEKLNVPASNSCGYYSWTSYIDPSAWDSNKNQLLKLIDGIEAPKME